MESRERLIKAYIGKKPDRVPIHIWSVYPIPPDQRHKRKSSFKPLFSYMKDKCDLIYRYDYDHGFMLSDCGGFSFYKDGKIVFQDKNGFIKEYIVKTLEGPLTFKRQFRNNQPAVSIKFWIDSEEDIQKFFSFPYNPIEINADEFFLWKHKLGDDGLVAADISSPAYYVHMLLGSEKMALWSIEKRSLLKKLFTVMTERVYDRIKQFLKAGIGPAYFFESEEYLVPPLQSPQDFEEFIVEYEKPLVDLIHSYGYFVRIHCHGKIESILEKFLDLGADALHPVEEPPLGDLTIEEFRQRIGNRISIEGNIQIGDIYTSYPLAIERKVRRIIEIAGSKGGLIIATTAGPLTFELPRKAFLNYKALIDAAHKYGIY